MKPSSDPQGNPLVLVRHQIWEAPEESAPRYRSIYAATLDGNLAGERR